MPDNPTSNALAHGRLGSTLIIGVVPAATVRSVSLPVAGPSTRDVTVGGITLVACVSEAFAVAGSPLCALEGVIVPGPLTTRETLAAAPRLGGVLAVIIGGLA